jgi:hypothetical protein
MQVKRQEQSTQLQVSHGLNGPLRDTQHQHNIMRPHDEDNQQIWNKLKEASPDADSEETGRVPFGKGLDRNDDNDDKPRGAEVGDFEKELVDLYWQVVDSGVDESLAGDWFDGVRLSLSELLRNKNAGDDWKPKPNVGGSPQDYEGGQSFGDDR